MPGIQTTLINNNILKDKQVIGSGNAEYTTGFEVMADTKEKVYKASELIDSISLPAQDPPHPS